MVHNFIHQGWIIVVSELVASPNLLLSHINRSFSMLNSAPIESKIDLQEISLMNTLFVSGVVYCKFVGSNVQWRTAFLLEIGQGQDPFFSTTGPTTEISLDLTSIEAYWDKWKNLKINLLHDDSLPRLRTHEQWRCRLDNSINRVCLANTS